MKLTNKFNIPQTFVNVLERPTYNKGKAHLSVTQLINSPKIVALTKKFEDEIEQDVSEMVWSLFGSAVHNILEHGKDANHIVEQRIHSELEGWNISGAVDLQVTSPEGISIRDYKTTSVWSVMNEKIEWEYQLNIYAWLIEKVKKTPVTDLGIVAVLRDWKGREAETKEGYPEAPIKEVPIVLWSMEEREEFIKARIGLHSACDFALETDVDLPDCTSEEMWEKPRVWAIMKIGGKRAHSLYETVEQAIAVYIDLGDKYEIIERKGERTRCQSYCPVSTWCNQYQTYLKEQA
jgi:hypothetical protein